MKITFDIPDNTWAGVLTILHGNWGDLTLHNHAIESKALHDGAVIAVAKKEGGE